MRYHRPVTLEARLAFILAFFAVWIILGLLPWTLAAVLTRGRGALPALPLALAGAAAGGVLIPLLGLRDTLGFLLSLPAALAGGALASAAGIALARRLSAPPTPTTGHDHETQDAADES